MSLTHLVEALKTPNIRGSHFSGAHHLIVNGGTYTNVLHNYTVAKDQSEWPTYLD